MTDHKEPVKEQLKEIKQLYKQFSQSSNITALQCGGSNTTIRLGGMRKILAAMKLDSKCVFLDIGSGIGLPCLLAAELYGCRCIGIEINPELVAIAQKHGKCQFIAMDASNLDDKWLKDHEITHVFMFDRVFPVKPWNRVIDVLTASNVTMFVSNFNKDFSPYKLEHKQAAQAVCTGESFTFNFFQKNLLLPEKLLPERKK